MKKLGIAAFAGVIALTVFLPEVGAGVRFIPPPPQQTKEMGDNQYPESRWGAEPKRITMRDRFSALEDEDDGEGSTLASVDSPADGPTRAPASAETAADHTAFETYAQRNPAGLEVSGRPQKKSEPAYVPPVEKSVSVTTEEERKARMQSFEDSQLKRKGIQEVAIIAGDLGYFPRTFFVSKDVPVRLYVTGASKNSLCIMMDSFQVRKQIRASKIEEITFTPNMPGTYRYYCPVNGMEGTMVVKEFANNDQGEN